MKDHFKWIGGSLDAASRGLGAAGMFMVALMAVVIVLDILLRLVRVPVLGLNELTSYALCVCAFLGFPLAYLSGRHIRVEIFLTRMKPKTRSVLEMIAGFAGFIFFGAMAWQNALSAHVAGGMGERSEMLGIPSFPVYLAIALGCLLLSLEMLKSSLNGVKNRSPSGAVRD